jgi:hypothetical protein
VNQHHDLGALGAAFNTRAAERQLEILRELGCNAIRLAHNPPAPELLDLCDTEGNQSNGGGSFETRRDDATGRVQIRWVPNGSEHIAQRAVGRSLGEIGSPVIGSGSGGGTSPWATPVGGR